jgi:hypothetical protein
MNKSLTVASVANLFREYGLQFLPPERFRGLTLYRS